MAYAAVASLRQTILRLVSDDSDHISIVGSSSTKILRLLDEELCSLENVLEEMDNSISVGIDSRSRSINRERVNALDGQIREAVCELEDILDFHVSDQIHSQFEAGDDEMIHPLIFTLDFEQLTQQFNSLEQTLIKLKAEYIHELCEEEEEDLEEEVDLEEEDQEEEEEEEVMDGVPSITDHHIGGDIDVEDESDSDDMVGLSDMFTQLKNRITENDKFSRPGWKITSISGMAGIGKTTVAKKLFRDPQIATLFQRRAFVTIGPNYRLEAVLLDILKKVNPEKDVKQYSTAFLKRMLYQSLKNGSCFIVLDDLWNKSLLKGLKFLLRNNSSNDCQVLLTSRLRKVAYDLAPPSATYHIPFLNKKESWNLLRKKVFGDQESSCPPQLVKAGKKIAENCDGLPLTILKVANILLSRADTTPEFWNEVADRKQHSVFLDAYEQMSEVLYPSYDYLSQYLKPFFLYADIFPQNYEIISNKLNNLWCGEGLSRTFPDLVRIYLMKLYDRNLVILLDESYYNQTKKISLHSVFWYMCNKEARKNKFFYCLNTSADTLAEDIKSQHRLCIQNNVLFGIKDVHDSISSISTVRSLLCTGAYHQYPVPICLGLRLLKVLHALTIRFYEFPMEALNRVNLMYLAVTLDVKLPSSISKLWNLKYLIVHQHVRTVQSPWSSSYLPMEIWDMKNLEHLQIMGSDLPNPCEKSDDDDHILPNLLVLSNVSAKSCTKDIFKRIPNLIKLGVQIELAPDDDEPMCFFDDIIYLNGLDKLKCIVTTPKIVSGVVVPPASLSNLWSYLCKLTLSGMGYPWDEMSNISSLPNLAVLKLRCYAFRGPKWVVVDDQFPKLESLFIEDTDLVKWTSLQHYYSLGKLCHLTIKHCYNLQEIPSTTAFGESLKKIDLVDCSPLAHSCAEQLKEHLDKQFPTRRQLSLNITSSWGDVK